MKAQLAKILTPAAIIAGCVIGIFIPLPDREKNSAEATLGTRASKGPANNSSAGIQIPAEITAEWAVECANSHPDEFYRWLLKVDPQPSGDVVREFFQAWILRDPDAAFQAALRLPLRVAPYKWDSHFFKGELQKTFWVNPMAALRWAGRIEGVICGGGSLDFDEEVFKKVENPDPEEIRNLLNSYPPGGVSAVMASAYARFLALKDMDAAVRWSLSLNVELQNQVFPLLLGKMAEEDPAKAMELLKNARSNVKQYAAVQALGGGSASSLLAGMGWLEEEMGISSHSGPFSLLARLYQKDPHAAKEYVVSLGGNVQRMAAAKGLGDAIAMGDRTAGVAMIVGLPDDLVLPVAHMAIARMIPGSFPAFLNPLNDNAMSPSNMDGYIHEMAKGLEQSLGNDPQDLLAFQDWLRRNPGPNRDRFILEAHELIKDKPEVLSNAFGKLPPGELERILKDH